MMAKLFKLVLITLALPLLSSPCFGAPPGTPAACVQFQAIITREAHAVYGLNAPIPMLAAQAMQESACRAKITAYDFGRGLYQFMDGTATQVAHEFPELGAPNPYDPLWATRAAVRFNKSNYGRVKGKDECEKWGAALKGYNAGLGYVLQAQEKSTDPTTWFTLTEYVQTRQTAKNFEYSRVYPRIIILTRQKLFTTWGHNVCLPYVPPGVNTFS